MTFSKTIAAGILATALISPSIQAQAFDLNKLGAELQGASDFLAQQRWGQATTSGSRSSNRTKTTRNETHVAYAGWEKEVGIRWAIQNDCKPRYFEVKLVNQPRYGKVHVRPVNTLIPNRSINGKASKTMARCAGLPTIGQGIYYTAPEGYGNYQDRFTIETSTGLRFNYNVKVEHVRG
ncbi:hypothetical protein [Roseibium sp.]|uniref:hypothetical protein n=1 Tax=Roseibium sp. TaxID=1936156 RepID=UPI003A987970